MGSGRLLYSVGPDRDDDHGEQQDQFELDGDIVFPLAIPAQ
jgi:hypothetical protein